MIFGKYFIGQNISEISNELTEISKEEYALMQPLLGDEKIYRGKDGDLCGEIWTTVIGITQGKVYKISLQTTPTEKIFDILGEGLWNKVYEKLNDEFGSFTDQQNVGGSFVTTWETKFGNVILNDSIPPDDDILSTTREEALDITVTGNFAFKGIKKIQQIGFGIFTMVAVVISQFVSPAIAIIIFILLGIWIGRKIDLILGKFFSKGIIKIGYVVFLCLLWGTAIAFGVKELFLLYDPKIILKIICYGAGIYLSYIYYQDNKINTMAGVIYGAHFKDTFNTVTIIANIIASIAFYIYL